jgi:hypothetical protein
MYLNQPDMLRSLHSIGKETFHQSCSVLNTDPWHSLNNNANFQSPYAFSIYLIGFEILIVRFFFFQPE